MSKFIGRSFVVVLASTVTPLAFAAHTHVTTPSTWTLNLGESDFGGGPSMKSDVFVVTVDNDKWARWSDNEVDGDGKTLKSSWSGPADGTQKPFTGMDATFSTNAATDVSIEKFTDGTVSTCTFSLSADKRKFTDKCVVKTKDGKQFHQTIVWDRTK